MTVLDRRTLLRRIARVGAALAVFPAAACAEGDTDGSGGADGPARGDLPASTETLGRTYLDEYPDEAELERLRSALGVTDVGIDPEDPFARWRREIRADFQAGRTVDVRGWMLSETEARVAALAVLERA